MSSEIPVGALVVLTPEGPMALSPDVADAPQDMLKRTVYDQLCALDPRPEIRTALVFVIDGDEQEVEMSRGDVRPNDVALLAQAYWYLPSWQQRTCLVHLVCDHRDDVLASIWPDILRAPVRGSGDGRHYAKVIALWRMAGSQGDMMDFDDAELVRTTTERLAQTVTVPPSLAAR